VLALITLALIAQHNSLRQITAWVAACDPTLSARLGFRFGRMPSYGTIRRVLLQLDLTALRPALARWAHSLSRTLPITDAAPEALLPLAIDGKTLCGSADGPDTPATRVSARLPTTWEPPWRKYPFLQRLPKPADCRICSAIWCWRVRLSPATRIPPLARCSAPFAKKGHYLVRVKDNQPRLMRSLTSFFASMMRSAQAATTSSERTVKGHGRLET
jgi:hypothetical protein